MMARNAMRSLMEVFSTKDAEKRPFCRRGGKKFLEAA
jgi:hypothetical protein